MAIKKTKASQKINKKKKGLLNIEITIGRVSRGQVALFAKHLAVMLRSGISIAEAIEITADSARGKFKRILKKLLKSVRSGRPFSSALSEHPKIFSSLFINATYAGESSGTLVENLETIAEQLKKENELIAKIKSAMMYPVIILGATFILGLILALVVLPKITPLFEGLRIELPATTRGLIWFSNIVQEYGAYLFFGIFVSVFFVLWLLRQKFMRPLTHWALLQIPILKTVVRDNNLSRFSRTLGTLLKSGVNVDEAIEITKDAIDNYYYKKALDKVQQSVGMGTTLSENLSRFENLFPLLVTRMVKIGEESGKFEETLFYLAGYYEAEVDNSTKALSTAVEPVLLIFIGITVGFLALSIITPIYNITGGIKK